MRDIATLVQTNVAPRIGAGRTDELQQQVRNMGQRTGIRITLVAMDGTVLADSEQASLAGVEQMDNHQSRFELARAAEFGTGRSERTSPTLDKPMLYYAVRTDTDGGPAGLVRVAIDTASVHQEMAKIQRLILFLAVFVSVSVVVLTYWVARRIIRPITALTEAAEAVAEGDYGKRVSLPHHDELSQLANAFTWMVQELSTQVGQLRTGRERLATVLGGMDEGVIAVDDKLRILFANGMAEQVLSFSSSEAEGRRLLEVVRHRSLYDLVVNTLSGAAPNECEMNSGVAGDRILGIRSTPLPGDPCPGVVMVLRDVTELRRLESLRREFVANVSHELKTPLSSIKAYAETLSQGAIDDPANRLHFVQQIEEQTERLHQLILDVLSLAQIESGKQAFEIKAVSLAGVVQSSLEYYRGGADAKQIVLQTESSPSVVHVRADEEAVRQILDNLVDNAIKYTPRGGQITVRWFAEQSLGVVQVQDNGIGISPNDQVRIFERFFRVDVARSRELGGTGLGLSIVKHLAQFFGGAVGVSSEPDSGSTFTVKLPLA
jgi:two-component system phosphate regulon sensor histidine kinase PhoR